MDDFRREVLIALASASEDEPVAAADLLPASPLPSRTWSRALLALRDEGLVEDESAAAEIVPRDQPAPEAKSRYWRITEAGRRALQLTGDNSTS